MNADAIGNMRVSTVLLGPEGAEDGATEVKPVVDGSFVMGCVVVLLVSFGAFVIPEGGRGAIDDGSGVANDTVESTDKVKTKTACVTSSREVNVLQTLRVAPPI